MSRRTPFELLQSCLERYEPRTIASTLQLSNGTIRRWIDTRRVPVSYEFDLLNMLGIPIDYSLYSFQEKDQYYTAMDCVRYCFEKMVSVLSIEVSEYTFIEPSAGDGRFLSVLPSSQTIALDIEPKHSSVVRQDFLSWTPPDDTRKIIVIGNPPFGLRGHLALKFLNHSATFARHVAFILPPLFDSDGKGVPRKRVRGLHLIHSETLHTSFESPDGRPVQVQCIFQIWTKSASYPWLTLSNEKSSSVLKVYSLSDGGTPSSTRNKKMLNKCDIYLPSTCFGKHTMKYYLSFEELPNRRGFGIVFTKDKERNLQKCKSIDWSNVAFVSTNSAYNLRTSQITAMFTETLHD